MALRGYWRTWAARAERLDREVYALVLAVRESRTPWYTKALLALVVGYALSPVDLLPDFVPVVGYLDDLVVVPAGVALAVRAIPDEVLADCRRRADSTDAGPLRWVGVAVVALAWVVVAALVVRALL